MHTPWPPTHAFKIRYAVVMSPLWDYDRYKIPFLSHSLKDFDSVGRKWDLGTIISPDSNVQPRSRINSRVAGELRWLEHGANNKESIVGELHFNKLPGNSNALYPSRIAELWVSGARVKHIHQSNCPQSIVPGWATSV